MDDEPDDESAAGPVVHPSRFDVHVDRHLGAHVSGELDVSTAPGFAAELDQLTVDGGVVCLDLSNLGFCGAAGINVLFDAGCTLGTRGRLVIYDPTPTSVRIIGTSTPCAPTIAGPDVSPASIDGEDR